MNKILKIILVVFTLLILVAAWILVRPASFLPHEKIVISLPFEEKYDSGMGLIPMGETKFHPKPAAPLGHPGIDFQWQVQVPIIASADGTITKIEHESSEGVDVIIQNGVYELRYKEMDESSLGKQIKVSNKIKKGDFIGYPFKSVGGDGYAHYQVHWEFASISVLKDRFCPLTYFDSVSKSRIEKIWANVSLDADQGIKRDFPDICSADYKNKVE